MATATIEKEETEVATPDEVARHDARDGDQGEEQEEVVQLSIAGDENLSRSSPGTSRGGKDEKKRGNPFGPGKGSIRLTRPSMSRTST